MRCLLKLLKTRSELGILTLEGYSASRITVISKIIEKLR